MVMEKRISVGEDIGEVAEYPDKLRDCGSNTGSASSRVNHV